ncbi:DUF637 domain-containing protein [Burkholderia gladioli]|uniref:DUF637 domain-containing protein n=1 Tax=Burkholderia gladioli TaxID=28095 RepID=UPI001640EB65|nr:DUF637 domain-containing protein [Burkholderia gladioli]
MSSAAGQLVGTRKLNLGSAFEAGAIAAIMAGLMNGITYSAESGLGFTTQPVTAGAGTQTLANLAGVKPVVGTVTNQATTAVTVDLGTRGLAMLTGGVIDAGVGTAIRGGSFLDALKGSLVSEVSAAGANAIGDASVSGSLVEAGTPGYWLAHAALGCASSAAMGTGCAGGAIGGAVSAGLNPIINSSGALPPAALAAVETLVSGSVAGALGFNVQGAVTAAQNETLNNFCEHNSCGRALAAVGAAIGGGAAAAGSVVADAATGGLNVVATPAEVAAGATVGAAVGGAIGSGLDWLGSNGGALFNSSDTESAGAQDVPSVPTDLVGEQDSKSGQRGNRNISGPLNPENGGTGDARKDFDKLTGGQSSPAPASSNYPPGTLIGPNGIAYRPGKNGSGARIDIPANGSKPHETLHY